MIVKIKCNFRRDGVPFLFASQNVQDDGPTVILPHASNWENRVLSISPLSRSMGDDKSYEISGVSIELNDTDRFFRKMMAGPDRYITGCTVELYSQDDRLLYTGTVDKWQYKEDAFVLFINDKLSGLDIVLPSVISLTEYPGIPGKAEGVAIPLLFGDLQSEKGAVACWRVDNGKYLLADHFCQAGQTLQAFREDGTVISNPVLENNVQDGRAYVICTGLTGVECVLVNVKGKCNDQGLLIEDPVEVIGYLIERAGMGFSSEAMESVREIMVAREYKIAAVIDQQKTLKEVLKEFCFSFDCDFYMDKSNRVVISLLNWSHLQPARVFSSRQVIDLEVEELPETIRNRVQYMYGYDWVSRQYGKSPVFINSSSIENWGEFFEHNEPLQLPYVAEGNTAFDIVQRYVLQRRNPMRMARMTLPLEEFSPLDIADTIEVEHPNAIDEKPRKYQIRRVNIDFISDTAEVEAVDITPFTGSVFILGDREKVLTQELQSNWAEVVRQNDDKSRHYGYLADRLTGYFSNQIDYGKVLY